MLWILLAVVVLAVIVAAVTVGLYRFTFYSPLKGRKEPAYDVPDGEQYVPYKEETLRRVGEIDAQPCERWEITARDGVRLSARFFAGTPGAPLEICCHGYRASAMRDFCGGFFLGKALGHNLLLIDERGCGLSGGTAITFGIRERYDVEDWAKESVRRLGADVRILLCGVSMGAATVLMASDLPLPENVKGIWADCPYSSPVKIIANTARGMKLPADTLMPFAKLGARVIGGFSVTESAAVTSVTRTKLPIEIIHGDDDRFVPYAMGREIAEAGHLPLHTVHGAGHALSFMVDRKLYEERFIAFVRRTVGGTEDGHE